MAVLLIPDEHGAQLSIAHNGTSGLLHPAGGWLRLAERLINSNVSIISENFSAPGPCGLLTLC